jgi:hypothetical protein
MSQIGADGECKPTSQTLLELAVKVLSADIRDI